MKANMLQLGMDKNERLSADEQKHEINPSTVNKSKLIQSI